MTNQIPFIITNVFGLHVTIRIRNNLLQLGLAYNDQLRLQIPKQKDWNKDILMFKLPIKWLLYVFEQLPTVFISLMPS